MRFDDFLKGLGASGNSFRQSYETDSDWALIIKLNAHIERALTFLIVKALREERIEDIIARLDLGDRKKGKLAFVVALDLLPSHYRGFIQRLFEIRNILAHGVTHIDFYLKRYMINMDSKKSSEFKNSVIPVLVDFLHGLPEKLALEELKANPRLVIFICAMAILTRIDSHHHANPLLCDE